MNATMAGTMCSIFVIGGEDGWVHLNRVPRHLINGGELSILVHWGLIELKKNEKPKKLTSGVWRLTAKGRSFVNRTLRVPSHAFIFTPGDRLKGWEETTTSVIESLGEHFNYWELMQGEG